MVITQRDKNIVNQNVKDLFVTVELLNSDMKVVDVVEGKLISDSFSIDANSAVRRTYSMDLLVTDSSMLIGTDKRIWMDKYIRPYICIKEVRTGEIIKYLKGTFVMLDSNYSFDSSTNTLSLSCSDLMSKLNGDRNGALKSSIKFEEDENVRELLVTLLKEANVTKYILSDLDGLLIPHEMEFDATQTYYDVLNEVVSLFSDFEMFFDINGTFIIQKIPHQDSDNVLLTYDFISPLVISEGLNTSFKEIYNRVVVWGQQLEPTYSTDTCTYDTSTNTYIPTIATVTSVGNFDLYAILIPQTNGADSKLTIAGTTAYIVDDKGRHIPAKTLAAATYNVFKYRKVNNDFYWLGEHQVYAEASETNTLSPFHKFNIGEEITKIFSGDEYSKIYSNSLAQDRANYELYHACRLQESINLNMIDIPWLDVNWLIEHRSYTTKDIKRYVTKQISGSTTGGTMDVSMVAFYDTDPYS